MFFRFADPYLLGLLILVPILGFWYFYRRSKKGATLRFSHLGFIKDVYKASASRARHILFILRLFALVLLIVAFARPQSGVKSEEILTQGIDIVLAMDVSSSMLAEDIKPNRIEAAKQVASEFIKKRTNDRIGLIVFSAEGYTQCPLTMDYGIVLSFLDLIKVGMIEDGTAIGMGLATAVNRLRTSEAKSKVIILLTDGRNNRGEVDPITAAQAAQAFDVKIYTIGAGTTQETAMYPVDHPVLGKRYVPMRVDIDEETLQRIAQMTDSRYFRATNRERLQSIYEEIDEMERTEIKVNEFTRYSELFHWFVIAAGLILFAEIVLTHTRFRKIP